MPSPSNFILVDFENVQPELLGLLTGEHIHLRVFVGANQNKVPFELADTMQRMGARAEYVKICGSGHNALDFHIAFTLGEIAAREPLAYLHVVSKDTGFDPLIQHLRDRKVRIQRVAAIEEIPVVQATRAGTTEERAALATARLAAMKTARPRMVKTLSSTIAAVFLKQIDEEEIAAIVARLAKKGVVAIDGEKVTYPS